LLSEFRVKKIPKDEESMREIIEEASRREGVEPEGGEQGGSFEEHSHGDPMHEQIHLLEHIVAQLSQLDSRLAEIDRGLSELTSKMDEVVKISRALIKISLANLIENRETRKKLIEDVMEEI